MPGIEQRRCGAGNGFRSGPADSRPPFIIGMVPRHIMDLCHGASWDFAVIAWNGAARNARRERQRRSIIQPRVVSFRRNYPGSIPPNQTANPERVESFPATRSHTSRTDLKCSSYFQISTAIFDSVLARETIAASSHDLILSTSFVMTTSDCE